MELRRLTLWGYFRQKTGKDKAGHHYVKVRIRALSPFRRKLVDQLSAWLGMFCTLALALLVIPLVIAEFLPLLSLFVIPLGGGLSYILLMALLILLVSKRKILIIDGQHVRIQRYIFLWAYLDRARHVTFTEQSYSPLSSDKLKEELVREAAKANETNKSRKPYYRHSKMLLIEHRGIPYHVMSIYDVVLAKQIRCRLQALLLDVPAGSSGQIAASPEEIWRRQAGDLSHG